MSAAAMPLRLSPFRRYLITVDGVETLFARSETEAVQSAARMATKPGGKLITVTTRDPDSGETREIWSSTGGKR